MLRTKTVRVSGDAVTTKGVRLCSVLGMRPSSLVDLKFCPETARLFAESLNPRRARALALAYHLEQFEPVLDWITQVTDEGAPERLVCGFIADLYPFYSALETRGYATGDPRGFGCLAWDRICLQARTYRAVSAVPCEAEGLDAR